MNQEKPPTCSLCGRNKKRYIVDDVTVWKCMNVNAHNAVTSVRARSGGVRRNVGRKRKKK